jgi:hypothetical protein
MELAKIIIGKAYGNMCVLILHQRLKNKNIFFVTMQATIVSKS